MELLFLIALLAFMVYFNRHLLGFGPKGCDWTGADSVAEDGSRKWMCQRCGQVQMVQGNSKPQDCAQPPDLKG